MAYCTRYHSNNKRGDAAEWIVVADFCKPFHLHFDVFSLQLLQVKIDIGINGKMCRKYLPLMTVAFLQCFGCLDVFDCPFLLYDSLALKKVFLERFLV